MTWKAAFDEKLDGNASDAARRVHEAWRKRAPREASRVTPRSLASRISALLGGDPKWWLKDQRRTLRGLFAELLGLEVDAVFGVSPTEPGMLSFPEFPAFPPLSPTENPCRVTSSGWLLHDAVGGLQRRDRIVRRWVSAPPGAGKSLVVRFLQARHTRDFVAASVRTLDEAVTVANTAQPLVVEIEEQRPATDGASLRHLERRGAPTVILAPFSLPEPMFVAPGSAVAWSETGWEAREVRLLADWRLHLLEWVHRRLEERDQRTKLLVAQVVEWCERCDPRAEVVATPGELLALCADFHTHGADGPTVSARAARWSVLVLPRMLSPDAPETWRSRGGGATWEHAVVEHVRRLDEEYGAARSEVWEALLPERLSPGATSRRPGGAIVVEYLRGSGLLRGGAKGIVPFPTWAALGASTNALASSFDAKDLAWGAVAADESRHHLVDAALDAIAMPSLMRVAGLCASYKRTASLAATGAIEATLAAIARRIGQRAIRLRDGDVAVIQRLMLRQLDLLELDSGYGQVHHPFTRRDFDEWFATAWTISLSVPPPSGFRQSSLVWELPGWADGLSLERAPEHRFPSTRFATDPLASVPMPGIVLASPGTEFTSLDFTEGTVGVAPWHVERVARLALRVVELDALSVGPLPEKVPRLLLPALILSTRGWRLDATRFGRLRRSWEEQFLARQIAALPEERRRSLAANLWDLAAEEIVDDGRVPVAERIQLLVGAHSALAPVVLNNLDPAVARATASTHGIHRRRVSAHAFQPSNPRALLDLPADARRESLRGWLEGAAARGARFDEARELTPLLAGEDIDLALELVRAGAADLASEFTSFVWASDAPLAREEARRAVREALPSAQGWFERAPRSELPFLASVLGAIEPLPTWAPDWARRRVLHAGKAGDVLFALTRGR